MTEYPKTSQMYRPDITNLLPNEIVLLNNKTIAENLIASGVSTAEEIAQLSATVQTARHQIRCGMTAPLASRAGLGRNTAKYSIYEKKSK